MQCSEQELLHAVVLGFNAQNRVLCSEPTVVCGANTGALKLAACCIAATQCLETLAVLSTIYDINAGCNAAIQCTESRAVLRTRAVAACFALHAVVLRLSVWGRVLCSVQSTACRNAVMAAQSPEPGGMLRTRAVSCCSAAIQCTESRAVLGTYGRVRSY